jgi:hypothetical protein
LNKEITMRIRTILAAAAAPAALAAVLLGTAGQASAAVNAKPVTYSANAHEANVADTTIGGLPGHATTDSPGGPVWANDNIERKLTATQIGTTNQWNVQISSQGSYAASANPLDGSAWNGNGSFNGYVNYVVTSDHAPNGALLPAQLDNTLHSADIVAKWFGLPDTSNVQSGNYYFDYNSVQVPTDISASAAALGISGVTYGVGPNGQHMVQQGA